MGGNATEPGRTTASRVLSLLDVFDASDELSLVEIAARANMPVATTYRHVRELSEWGGLERLQNRRYRVGLRLWEIGSRAPRQRDLRDVSRAYMQDLYEATRENVQVGVRDGGEVLIIEMVSGRNAVPTATQVGCRLPLHATAVGRVTLAFSEPELLDRTLNRGLPKLAPRTITMPGTLVRAVEQTRRTHVGYVVEEMTRGAASVACPILGRDGSLIASIALVVRASTNVEGLAPAVRTAALSLSRELARLTTDS
jgi:DNA-binding IclR family transcriptional regulator